MFHREMKDKVAIVRLDHGKVNSIDLELISALEKELTEIESSSIVSVVLTGKDTIFSGGVDLIRFLKSGPEYVAQFVGALSRLLERLFLFPKPIVAAINGHAIAGGCVMACTCDYRFMVDGKGKIGVAELPVGVPFPCIAFEIMRAVVPHNHIRKVIYTGQTFSAQDALQIGLIDEIAQPDSIIDKAVSVANQFGNIHPPTFKVTKEQFHLPVLEMMKNYPQSLHDEIASIWNSPQILGVIQSYLDKTIRKKR